jgi:uncharacterized protein YjbI with pentapeptide repeats
VSPIKAPRLPSALTTRYEEADADALSVRDERDRERFADADLSGRDLTGSSFAECSFESVSFDGTQLRGSRFTEVQVIDSFAPSLLAARTTWRDAVIENPRWGSAELFEADLTTVHIRGGKIDYLNLRTARLTDVRIENCTITDLDLAGVRGTRIALVDCRIETLDVTRATLVDVDLRSTTLEVVNGLNGLKGATIDDYQLSLFAPLLASHLGIRVE